MESKLSWDVIQEILLRLPVKSLVRFKCVCKSWLSLISDSQFAKSHYELSAAPTHKLLQITRSGSEARPIDFDASLNDDSFVVSLVPPFPKPGKYAPHVLIFGSCRGFVLIKRYSNFYIWNPSTGFHRELSYSEIGKQCQSEDKFLTGFGYDPSTDDYLVVVLWAKYYLNPIIDDNGDDDVYVNLKVDRLVLFSLRTNSLKEIQGPHLPDMYSTSQPLFFNDAIHWLASGYNSFVILAFDMVNKNFFEISLPDGCSTVDFYFCKLGSMGGCLCLCHFDDTKTKVWIMKEYKVQSSWTMLEIPGHVSAVCMAKDGELVALRFDDGEVMKFNDKGELLERCEYCSDDLSGFDTVMYRESLLSVPHGQMESPSIEAHQSKYEC
ncbi:F-box/kelch-repeat protein At3g23880-like [Gastrolobium bilobum]|uniref:F-box/kelch-repeat protein At3g23880-like n=1 Tax=Gastrolobium bilobum TaxID=150636 RepID=UPI002AB28960|nr:F-box/kelch-repeat protein At3g23880-like [Gastrolobium bilobum]